MNRIELRREELFDFVNSLGVSPIDREPPSAWNCIASTTLGTDKMGWLQYFIDKFGNNPEPLYFLFSIPNGLTSEEKIRLQILKLLCDHYQFDTTNFDTSRKDDKGTYRKSPIPNSYALVADPWLLARYQSLDTEQLATLTESTAPLSEWRTTCILSQNTERIFFDDADYALELYSLVDPDTSVELPSCLVLRNQRLDEADRTNTTQRSFSSSSPKKYVYVNCDELQLPKMAEPASLLGIVEIKGKSYYALKLHPRALINKTPINIGTRSYISAQTHQYVLIPC